MSIQPKPVDLEATSQRCADPSRQLLDPERDLGHLNQQAVELRDRTFHEGPMKYCP